MTMTAHTAAKHGLFNRISQVVPTCNLI